MGSLKIVLIPVKVFRILGTETSKGRVNVYLAAIPCLVRPAFIFSGVKNGKQMKVLF